MSSSSAPPLPRVCHLEKAYADQEYGFNLHAEIGRGQYIGSVDYDSPAEKAGLQQGDRIVAVNGISVSQMTHKEVVGKIKANPSKCTLTVIDEIGEQWYRDNNLSVPLMNAQAAAAAAAAAAADEPSTLKPSANDGLIDGIGGGGESKPLPKLCKLVKNNADQEYGFNLHAERNRGHFIGSVDLGSVARRAQLKEGQRIVGVNGTLVYVSTSHKEVVRLIRQDPMQVELLVASPEVDAWYRSREMEFSFSDAEVVPNRAVPKIRPQSTIECEEQRTDGPSVRVEKREVTTITVTPQPPVYESEASMTKETTKVNCARRTVAASDDKQAAAAAANGSTTTSSSCLGDKQQSIAESKHGSAGRAGGEQWTKLTAAEMRLYLQRNKKSDPRSQQLSMEKKYEIAQNL